MKRSPTFFESPLVQTLLNKPAEAPHPPSPGSPILLPLFFPITRMPCRAARSYPRAAEVDKAENVQRWAS